jgi:hypothetical protein
MIVEVSEERAHELIDKVSKFIAERRMGAPAILFLETVRPLNFIGSQAMFFIAPFVTTLLKGDEFEEFAAMIGERKYTEVLIKRIDDLDEQLNREAREKDRIKRKKFWKRITRIFKKKDKDGGTI